MIRFTEGQLRTVCNRALFSQDFAPSGRTSQYSTTSGQLSPSICHPMTTLSSSLTKCVRFVSLSWEENAHFLEMYFSCLFVTI